MNDQELFPRPVVGYAFVVSLSGDGTYRVRAQSAVEGSGFGESVEYSSLSLHEVCDVMCAELWKF